MGPHKEMRRPDAERAVPPDHCGQQHEEFARWQQERAEALRIGSWKDPAAAEPRVQTLDLLDELNVAPRALGGRGRCMSSTLLPFGHYPNVCPLQKDGTLLDASVVI